jgi:hypothetical protein
MARWSGGCDEVVSVSGKILKLPGVVKLDPLRATIRSTAPPACHMCGLALQDNRQSCATVLGDRPAVCNLFEVKYSM